VPLFPQAPHLQAILPVQGPHLSWCFDFILKVIYMPTNKWRWKFYQHVIKTDAPNFWSDALIEAETIAKTKMSRKMRKGTMAYSPVVSSKDSFRGGTVLRGLGGLLCRATKR
jgi:hypothetical protein